MQNAQAHVRVAQTIIARQELELSKVINDYEHYKKLSRLGVVSNFDIEAKRLQVKIEREKLSQAKAEFSQHIQTVNQLLQNSIANLAVTKQVKPTDILVAKTELQEAISKLQQAEIDLASTYIVSPIDGQVLNINTRVGELEGKDGILEIGNTKQMYVVGEVYESDIKYLKLGQSASIVSEYGGFSGKISGVVDQIGLPINQPGIVNKDPNAKSDVRVVQVKIRLNPHDGNRVKALNNLEVRALIKI